MLAAEQERIETGFGHILFFTRQIDLFITIFEEKNPNHTKCVSMK